MRLRRNPLSPTNPRMSAAIKHLDACPPRPFSLPDFLATRTTAINRALDRFLPTATAKPATIHRAMRYSLFAGGKRIRPLCVWPPRPLRGKRDRAPFHWPAPSSASIPIHWSTTTSRPWTTTITGAANSPPQSLRRGHCGARRRRLLTLAFEIAARCQGWPATRTRPSSWNWPAPPARCS